MIFGNFYDLREIGIVLVSLTDISRINPVFGEGLGTLWMFV